MLHPYSRILCRHVPSVPVNPSIYIYIFLSLSLCSFLSIVLSLYMHARGPILRCQVEDEVEE